MPPLLGLFSGRVSAVLQRLRVCILFYYTRVLQACLSSLCLYAGLIFACGVTFMPRARCIVHDAVSLAYLVRRRTYPLGFRVLVVSRAIAFSINLSIFRLGWLNASLSNFCGLFFSLVAGFMVITLLRIFGSCQFSNNFSTSNIDGLQFSAWLNAQYSCLVGSLETLSRQLSRFSFKFDFSLGHFSFIFRPRSFTCSKLAQKLAGAAYLPTIAFVVRGDPCGPPFLSLLRFLLSLGQRSSHCIALGLWLLPSAGAP